MKNETATSWVPQSLLAEAKAFLCWDMFENLSIQLVPQQKTVAFYYPPGNDIHSIVLFYQPDQKDFSEPLFLLFHEAGHIRQFEILGDSFYEKITIPNGKMRQNFERQAWCHANTLLAKFIEKYNLDVALLTQCDEFARASVASYAEDPCQSKC